MRLKFDFRIFIHCQTNIHRLTFHLFHKPLFCVKLNALQTTRKDIVSMILRGHSDNDERNGNKDSDFNKDTIRGINEASALHVAVQNGRLHVVKMFLSLGLDPNRICESKGTPLLCAAIMGHAEIAKILIESGANARLRNLQNGTTPLYVASQNGHVEVVRVLLNIGKADPNEIGANMNLPLYVVFERTCRSMA